MIPLQPKASQTVEVALNFQNCNINVYQRFFGLFFDLQVNSDPLLYGVLCHNRSLLVRYKHLNFIGDFVFVDAQGSNDPAFSGLGSRYELLYLEPGDLSTLGFAA